MVERSAAEVVSYVDSQGARCVLKSYYFFNYGLHSSGNKVT